MGILFKTYNGKHQLHVYNEVWALKTKQQLDDILSYFDKKEVSKAVIKPINNQIELELNGLIVNCKDIKDLKLKFGQLVDLKEQFQKLTASKQKI